MRGTDNLLSKYDTFGSHLFAFCSFRNMFTASITRQGDAVDRSLLKSVLGMLCSLNVSQSLQLFTDRSIVGLGSRAVLMFWLPACFSASLGNIFHQSNISSRIIGPGITISMIPSQMYQSHFEIPFLQQSQQHYSSEGQQQSQKSNVSTDKYRQWDPEGNVSTMRKWDPEDGNSSVSWRAVFPPVFSS